MHSLYSYARTATVWENVYYLPCTLKKKNSKGTSYKGRGGVFFIIHVQMALVCKKYWMPTNTFNWILFIWIESVEEGENRL